MRRFYGVLAVVLAVIALGGEGSGLAEQATPCAADSPQAATYQFSPQQVIILHGEGNAAETLLMPPSYAGHDALLMFTVAYTGSGRFAATITEPPNTTHALLTAISPVDADVGFNIYFAGPYRISVTADAAWTIIVSQDQQ